MLASWYTKFALVAEEGGFMWNIQIIGGWETCGLQGLPFGKVAPDASNERFLMFAILFCLWVTYLADISSGKILCSSLAR